MCPNGTEENNLTATLDLTEVSDCFIDERAERASEHISAVFGPD